jgi:UPF0716 family protein affecting phage T7 exclusion
LILAPVFIYVLPVVTLLAVAMLGSTRRLGFWWTLLASILLTPIVGFALALLSGPIRRKPTARPRAALARAVEVPATSEPASPPVGEPAATE